ncbi:3'(2'),5'-bisphosphate nucleotidase CysQ [Psychrobium sp. MM17-31]|uniref:3'(2'),5'-bisphosphate nucleotidase CysQ n=1 Tax=Psychrobium sp. MM17-31 TaxID=2917758 RepID=UPI001EF4A25E|nr:3'(2'),5'-bisphosphate nucleotidase CysQ [Psychrobium sp. MM17-31]MCG7532207.1 3'(2'),5'-bisphosphate nucleotidase CysQ [Psychrobium sp. MM17-31]
MDLTELTLAVEQIARDAGGEIKRIYEQGQFETFTKDDESPVTSADYAANEVIVSALQSLTPNIPIVSEESDKEAIKERRNWQRYWLIDPLDGTQEFVAGSGDFAVAIALVVNHIPTIGVIYAPIHDRCYFAIKGEGAFRRDSEGLSPIKVDTTPRETVRIAVSLRQAKALVESRLSESFTYEYIAMGSATLKACLVAQGGADIYMRIGPTGEWDTGAAHCIVAEAGGDIFDLSINRLTYNERETLANPNFVVCGNLRLPWADIVLDS